MRQGVQRILDTINTPAYARNGRMDILATNRLGRALFSDAVGDGGSFNLARYLFLDPRSQDFYPDGDRRRRLRRRPAHRRRAHPYDRGLTDLVGELSTRSEPFRTLWATHNVKLHHTATKTMHHPGRRRVRAHRRGAPAARRPRSDPHHLHLSNPRARPSRHSASSPAGAPGTRPPRPLQPATRSDVAPRPDQQGHA